MTGQELRKWRESQGLRQKDLAAMLNEATGRRYDGAAVGVWERGAREIPPAVRDFLSAGGPPNPEPTREDGEATPLSAPPSFAPGEDVPPAPPDSPRPLGLVAGGGQYAVACQELWEMFGVSMQGLGSFLNKPALHRDGQIICGWDAGVDSRGNHFNSNPGMKKDLGVAYGKLAERNQTFRRLVLAMSQESVWAEVCLVTARLAITMVQNHQRFAVIEMEQRRARAEAAAQQPQPQAA